MQKENCVHNLKAVATKESKLLRDGRTGNTSKSVACSALRQKRK